MPEKTARLPAHDSLSISPPTARPAPKRLRDVPLTPGGNRPAVPLSDVARVSTARGAYDGLFLSNYATLKLRDELSRVPGVGDVTVRGVGAYAMRIWLNPDKLAARDLTTEDVLAALRRQNVQVAAGQVGQPPNPSGQRLQLTVTTLGRLSDAEQFEGIIVKSGGAGQIVYLRDVAEVELGAQSYDSFSSRSGFESANILIFQLPGSNALDVAKGIREAMERIKPTLPPGMEYSIPFDTTKFVDSAIKEVYMTLLEAGGLVLLVILVFLHSWRALLVPATTVPVTIIGAFAFMPLLGFSINLLTLFGLILAIGIVVDDAIVIVENAHHHIERGVPPREATIRAMNEVTGPVISITLVLMAVFLPTAFLGGITGQLYQQFALTIAATAFISAVNALTLKPAQCAMWLKHAEAGVVRAGVRRRCTGRSSAATAGRSGNCCKVWWVVLLVFLGVAVFTAWLYQRTPTGSFRRKIRGTSSSPSTAGRRLARSHPGDGTEAERHPPRNAGGAKLVRARRLLDARWNRRAERGDLRSSPGKTGANERPRNFSRTRCSRESRREFGAIPEAPVPSARSAVDSGARVRRRLPDADRGPRGRRACSRCRSATQEVIDAGGTAARVRTGPVPAQRFRAGVPQIYLNIDRVKAEQMGVKMDDVFRTLQANLGSVYVNDFNKFGRTYQVRVQADAGVPRGNAGRSAGWKCPGGCCLAESVRWDSERSVLFWAATRLARAHGRACRSARCSPTEVVVGPQSIIRYNLYPTAQIQGQAKQGVSSGQALAAMEEVANEYASRRRWGSTGRGSRIRRSGWEDEAVFCLRAGRLARLPRPCRAVRELAVAHGRHPRRPARACWAWWRRFKLRGMDNNIYTQIGIVLIIALASKNAILIVEFARELRLTGRSIRDAAVEAARMRFRPIIMTSFAFIFGVLAAGLRDRRRRGEPPVAGHGGGGGNVHGDGPGGLLRARPSTSRSSP